MSRRERRVKARQSKIENLYRPVKASRWVLIIIAIIAAIVIIVTQFVQFS